MIMIQKVIQMMLYILFKFKCFTHDYIFLFGIFNLAMEIHVSIDVYFLLTFLQ